MKGGYMPDFDDSDVKKVAEQISGYLKIHPNAADTVEGIAKWWLPGKRIEISKTMIQRALDQLVSSSVVEINTNLSGHNVYSSKKQRSEL
jgi:hypothetical protein